MAREATQCRSPIRALRMKLLHAHCHAGPSRVAPALLASRAAERNARRVQLCSQIRPRTLPVPPHCTTCLTTHAASFRPCHTFAASRGSFMGTPSSTQRHRAASHSNWHLSGQLLRYCPG